MSKLEWNLDELNKLMQVEIQGPEHDIAHTQDEPLQYQDQLKGEFLLRGRHDIAGQKRSQKTEKKEGFEPNTSVCLGPKLVGLFLRVPGDPVFRD